MTNNQLTGEWLQGRIANMECYGVVGDEALILQVYRIALAAMDSEPVAYISKSDFDAGYPHILARRDFNKACTMPVYAAQPAPVVPELRVDWQENEFSAGWNACRAAMLQELKKVQELKRSAGVTKMCRCYTPNLRRNPIAARRKTSSFQRKAQSITVIYQSANAQGVRLLPESAQKWPSTLW